MDWYAWLSETNLDAALIYDYGLTLVRNELQQEDLPYFNHDFLQSIGISVAKHRLEILKLCRKQLKPNNGLSRLINKTRKLFSRNITKLAFNNNAHISPYRNHWSGALRRNHNGGNVMWSGPIDRRLQEKLMAGGSMSGPLDVKMMMQQQQQLAVYPNWSPMVGRPNERSGFTCRSPTMSGPIDRLGLSPNVGYYTSDQIKADDLDGVQSLWSIMFQDMKPT